MSNSSTTLRRRIATLIAALMAISVLSFVPSAGADPADAPDISEACAAAEDAGFTDIAGTGFETEINCLAALEVTTGTTATTYSPAVQVRRSQMALFYYRIGLAAGYSWNTSDAGFTDLGGLDTEFVNAINALANAGVVNGTTDTTFDPQSRIRRSQMALFIDRAQDAFFGDAYSDDAPADDVFPDIADLSDEARAAVNGIGAAGITQGDASGRFVPSGFVSRQQMAAFIVRHLVDNGFEVEGEIGPNESLTNAPELASVEKGASGIVRFNFDQPIPGITALPTSFRLYTADGVASEADDVAISGSTVIARFSAAEVASAVRAGVRTGAVASGAGLPSIAGDFPLRASAVQVAALNPQLTSVGNYRFADEISLGTNLVLVDFVFNTATNAQRDDLRDAVDAIAAADMADHFNLVGQNGELYPALVTEEAVIVTPLVDNQLTVTVAFASDPTDVPESQLRRGVFESDYLGGDDVVWSAGFGSTGSITTDPDLVSVTREGTTGIFRFTFDEAVSATAADIVAGNFYVVYPDGSTEVATSAARLADADAATIRAQFPVGATDFPVYAFVTDSAVLATDSATSDFGGYSRRAAQPITVPLLGDPAPGVTALPDLVSAVRVQDAVTGRRSVLLTFDQTFPLAELANIDIELYDANGVRFTSTGALPGSVAGLPDTTIIVSAEVGHVTDDQIAATVTAAVQTSSDVLANVVIPEAQVDARLSIQN